MTAIERLNELREENKQKREAINKECKAVFEAEAKTIFEKHPKLDSFKWRQYTPYFNDGEECIFGRHDADIGFAGKEYEYWDDKDDVDGLNDAFKSVLSFMEAFEEEDYKFMFEDHVEVTVNRNGVTVEDCNHD